MQRFMDPSVQIPWMRSSRFVSLTGESVAPHWIGSKPPTSVVYAAAFADFDPQPMLDALEALPWEDQLSVQVLIRSNEDDCWSLWMFVDGTLRELQLPGAVRVPATEYGRQWRRHLIRRPPPTELSRPWMVQLYAEGTEWRYVLHADGYLTATYGVLGEAQGAGREDARRRMTEASGEALRLLRRRVEEGAGGVGGVQSRLGGVRRQARVPMTTRRHGLRSGFSTVSRAPGDSLTLLVTALPGQRMGDLSSRG